MHGWKSVSHDQMIPRWEWSLCQEMASVTKSGHFSQWSWIMNVGRMSLFLDWFLSTHVSHFPIQNQDYLPRQRREDHKSFIIFYIRMFGTQQLTLNIEKPVVPWVTGFPTMKNKNKNRRARVKGINLTLGLSWKWHSFKRRTNLTWAPAIATSAVSSPLFSRNEIWSFYIRQNSVILYQKTIIVPLVNFFEMKKANPTLVEVSLTEVMDVSFE